MEFQCQTCGDRSLRAEYEFLLDDRGQPGLWTLWCLNNHRVNGHAGSTITINVPQEAAET